MRQIVLIFFLFLLATTSVNAQQCSKRKLQNVCNSCAQQALNNLDTDSICPSCNSCPVCPTCRTCDSKTTAAQRLKSNYRLTTSVITGRQEIYDINIININRSNWAYNFTYDATQLSRLLVIRSANGYTNYDTVVFWLPLNNGGFLQSIVCTGEIDTSGTIEGACRGVSEDGLFTRLFGGEFTAISIN